LPRKRGIDFHSPEMHSKF